MAKRQAKAKTAWELLERVCAHILEEPKRYDQSVWGLTPSECRRQLEADERPACNTQGCRAGWVVALHDGLPSFHRRIRRIEKSIGARANRILGMDYNDTFAIFRSDAVDPMLQFEDRREYAQVGVSGLRAFMKQHAKHLKARSLKGV